MNRLLAAVFLAVVGCTEQAEVPIFQLVPVSNRDITILASAAGSVEPILIVEVKSKASGEILDVRVETGDEVTRGKLLVRVDQRIPRNGLTQAEADLEVAQAQLSNAEAQLRRAQALYETQSITEQEFDDARLGQANAIASLVRAERSKEDAAIAFEDTEVRAPTNGIILERNVEVGSVIQSATSGVSGGEVLLLMANLDTVQVRTLVDETDIGKISPNLRVSIRVDAYPNQPFQGRVLKIEPQAVTEQNVTMFPVLIRIPNEDGLLRPGMNSEVEIQVASRRGVLTVPDAALRTRNDFASAAAVLGLDIETVEAQLRDARQGLAMGNGTMNGNSEGDAGSGFQFGGNFIVFALRDGVPKPIPIRTGLTDLDYHEVLAGDLTEGDSLVVLTAVGAGQAPQGGR
ncbi:MAG: efflux RND transporter periplasmic adaptor subunit [Gemmatimonadetes bacterium]|nr:efflux RND transporter periplasmic adaptor subunit [Gemmatimonadota bacterium]